MAYDGGYQGQRPFNGAPRPPPQRQYPGGPGPQQYNQQYDQYQGDYGYDEYGGGGGGGGGYDQGYGGQYDNGYGQRGPPPPRDPYGPGPGRGGPARGPSLNGGRGMPPRSATAGPYPGPGRPPPQNGPPGPGLGPGRGRPAFPHPNSDPSMNRQRPPLMESQKSPGEPGFGDSPFPTFPGQNRKTNLDEEQQILSQMGGLDIDGKKPKARAPPTRGPSMDDYGPPRPSMDSQRGPPPRNYPPQGYPDPRRGPPPPDRGYGDYAEQEFRPPVRTRTMPNNAAPPDMAYPPQRADTVPYNGQMAPGMGPQRPSTAQGYRPPPQAMPPPNRGPPPGQGGGYEYDGGYNEGGAYDGGYYDEYYNGGANGYPPQNQLPPEPDMPNFEATPRGRSSLDLSMQDNGPGGPGGPAPQMGPKRYPELNKTKSQPDLRQPQQAVFEMAQDAPPMPPMGGYDHGGYDQGQGGLPMNPKPMRPGHQQMPPGANFDALPSHPTPVRAGHMPGSLVNNKPAPVRNYGGNPAPAPAPGPTPSPAPLPMQGGGPPPSALPKQQEAPVTAEELETLRNLVKMNAQDQQSALRLAKKLIEASDVLNLSDPKARKRYLLDAQKILKKLANAQNPDAMFTLADGLGKGMFGSEPDNKEAFTMYQSAAKLGHAAAAYRTAVCCEIGNEEGGGTRRDPLKAMQWYKRAATLGDTPAMYKVGMILLKGLLGQPRNPREAISWLKRAAEAADSENPHALHELGLLYESAGPNDVIIRDEPYAFQLFKQAADLGYKFSQFRLGSAYEYGLMGCPVEPRLSIMWYSKAAEQGEHQSELALSGWYLTGSDNVLGQNDTEAYLWARKAALAGLAKAEYAMGYFTEMGIGVPANLEDAKRWYWRAAAQDFPKARERLEELKRSGKNGPRQRERITRSKIGQQNEGECSVM